MLSRIEGGSEEFDRSWADYTGGFGQPSSEHFIGKIEIVYRDHGLKHSVQDAMFKP